MNQKQLFKNNIKKCYQFYTIAGIIEIFSYFFIILTIALFVTAAFLSVSSAVGAVFSSLTSIQNQQMDSSSAGQTTSIIFAFGVIFSVISSLVNFVRFILLILAIIKISAIRDIAAINKFLLSSDPFIPGILAFFLPIFGFICWYQASKLNAQVESLVNKISE